MERRSEAPLLRLDFFYNSNFAVASVVTVIGMFAFLGTAYSTSIRLSAIQGFSPLKTSVAFLFLNATALVQLPLTIRLLKRHNPKWPLVAGLVLMASGALWLAAIPAAELSLVPVIAPFILVGSGFALSLSALTLIAVNTAPNHLAGMASGTTNMLRDFGFTLGPAIIGAVALSQAAAAIRQQLAAHPALQRRVRGVPRLPGARPGGRSGPRSRAPCTPSPRARSARTRCPPPSPPRTARWCRSTR